MDLAGLHSISESPYAQGRSLPEEKPVCKETVIAKAAIEASSAFISVEAVFPSSEALALRSLIPAADLAFLEEIAFRVMPGYSFISVILSHCLLEKMLIDKGPFKIVHPLGRIVIAGDKKEFKKLEAAYEKQKLNPAKDEGGGIDNLAAYARLVAILSDLVTDVGANHKTLVQFFRALLSAFFEEAPRPNTQICCLINVAIALASTGHAEELLKPIPEIFAFPSRKISAAGIDQKSPISFLRLIGLSRAISIAPFVAHKLFDLILDLNDANFTFHEQWGAISSSLTALKRAPAVELLKSLFHDEVTRKYTISELIDIRRQIQHYIGSNLCPDHHRYRNTVNTLYSYFDQYEEFYNLMRGLGEDCSAEVLESFIARSSYNMCELLSNAASTIDCIRQFSKDLIQTIRFYETKAYLRLYMKHSSSLCLITPEMGVADEVIRKNILAFVSLKGIKKELAPFLNNEERMFLKHIDSIKSALPRWLFFVSNTIDPAAKTFDADFIKLKELQKCLQIGFKRSLRAEASRVSLEHTTADIAYAQLGIEVEEPRSKSSSPTKVQRTTPTLFGIFELITLAPMPKGEVTNSLQNAISYLQDAHHLLRETELHLSTPRDAAFHILDMLKSSYFALEQLLTGLVLEKHKGEDSSVLFERLGHSLSARFEESGIKEMIADDAQCISVQSLIRSYEGIDLFTRELPHRYQESRALRGPESLMRSETFQEGDLEIIISHRERAKEVIKTFFFLASLSPYFEQKKGDQKRFLELIDEETFSVELERKGVLVGGSSRVISEWAPCVESIAYSRNNPDSLSSFYNFDAMLYQVEQLVNNPLLRFRGIQARLNLRQAFEYALINALSPEKKASYDYRHDLFSLVLEVGLSESELNGGEREFLQKSSALRNKLRYEKIRQRTPSPEYSPEVSFSPPPFAASPTEEIFTLVESKAVTKVRSKIMRELQITRSILSKISSVKK